MTGCWREPSAAWYSRPKRAGWLKSYWIVDICQVRPIASHAAQRSWVVERGATRVGHETEPGLLRRLAQDLGRHLPLLVRADELVVGLVAGRQLEVVVVETEVRSSPRTKLSGCLISPSACSAVT